MPTTRPNAWCYSSKNFMASSLPCLWLVGLLVIALHGLQSAARPFDDEQPMAAMHEQWMARFRRAYKDSKEKAARFQIFKDNVELIQAFNNAGAKPYKLGINGFADMTNEEFRSARNGHRRPTNRATGTADFKYENVADVPPSMDWRKEGAVTPIRDQGSCDLGISAVAAVEGIHEITTNQLVTLSVQQILDCSTDGEGKGCTGGFVDDVYLYITKNGGLASEATYPYTGAATTCNTTEAAAIAAKVEGFEGVPANDENALLRAVANQPVSVAVDAGGAAFQFYESGIFTGECGTELDHWVTIVGYGVTGDGIKYWIVKNSWGTAWGEEGYMRMERDVKAKSGLCGIAMEASYPIA